MKVALLIEYDGTKFAGWQSQRAERTVQSELEAGFQKIFAERIIVHGAGRTDTGVHARGMVAHVDLLDGTDLFRLLPGINATTGNDVVVLALREVAPDFHARHSAESREYAYTILRRRTALERNTAWAVHYPLAIEAMDAVARLLIGEHDFTAFSKRSPHVEHYRCIVEHAQWVARGTRFVFRIRANRFVRGMVRALVGAMVEIGRGNSTVEAFEHALHHPEELSRAKYLAPARGLVLGCVRYPERFGLWNEDIAPTLTNVI